MHVVILCDSKFGNTKRLAEAMETALSVSHDVELRAPADGLPDVAAIDFLLVGGPTHAHGASAPLKTTLAALPKGSLAGASTATFDTRLDMAKILTGSAAGSAEKLLKRAGATSVAPPESFFVSREDPPTLARGRARASGRVGARGGDRRLTPCAGRGQQPVLTVNAPPPASGAWSPAVAPARVRVLDAAMETVDGQPTASSARLSVTLAAGKSGSAGKVGALESVARGDVGEDRPEPALGYVLERGHGIGDAVTVRVEADLVSDGADGDGAGRQCRGKRHRKVEGARMRSCLDADDVEVARLGISDGVRDDRTCLAGC